MNLGEQLRALRVDRAGLELAEVETLSGVSARTVAMWELGHREPSLSLLAFVLSAYAQRIYPDGTPSQALRALILDALGVPTLGSAS